MRDLYHYHWRIYGIVVAGRFHIPCTQYRRLFKNRSGLKIIHSQGYRQVYQNSKWLYEKFSKTAMYTCKGVLLKKKRIKNLQGSMHFSTYALMHTCSAKCDTLQASFINLYTILLWLVNNTLSSCACQYVNIHVQHQRETNPFMFFVFLIWINFFFFCFSFFRVLRNFCQISCHNGSVQFVQIQLCLQIWYCVWKIYLF